MFFKRSKKNRILFTSRKPQTNDEFLVNCQTNQIDKDKDVYIIIRKILSKHCDIPIEYIYAEDSIINLRKNLPQNWDDSIIAYDIEKELNLNYELSEYAAFLDYDKITNNELILRNYIENWKQILSDNKIEVSKYLLREFPEDFELISFFESEPELDDKETNWFYNTLTFEFKNKNQKLVCRISPASREFILQLFDNNQEIINLEIYNFAICNIIKDKEFEYLLLRFSENSECKDFMLFLKPSIRVIWKNQIM